MYAEINAHFELDTDSDKLDWSVKSAQALEVRVVDD